MSRPRQNSGLVLALVLVVVAILSVVAVSQLFMMRGELGAAVAARQGHQAHAAAMSGIQRAMALLAGAPKLEDWTDNPTVFEAQLVAGTAQDGWLFTVYAPITDDAATLAGPGMSTSIDGLRYGLEDEAGKLNLNIAPVESLSKLLGSDELAKNVVEYRTGTGAVAADAPTQDYYVKHAPLTTLEELLLVKGITGTIVYGEDANGNGLLDPNEDDGDDSFPPDNRDGQLDRGLRPYATAVTYEPNVTSAGAKRININTADPASLRSAGLSQQTASYVAAARQQSVTFPDPSALLAAPPLTVNDPARPGQQTQITSGVNSGNLAQVMDVLTSGGVKLGQQEILIGRVNVNTAPKQVLACLPGLDDATAETIVARRAEAVDEQGTIAWLVSKNVLTSDGFKKVAPYLTARSFQYRVRSMGYSFSTGRFCVLEAVIDTASGRPRISYLRDLTGLGVPFAPIGDEK